MEKKYYVYIHIDKTTGLIVYCGKGSNSSYQDYSSRAADHIFMMKNNQLEYFILQYFANEIEAYNHEEKVTRMYKEIKQCGFNIALGRRTSEQTKKKLSKVLRGKKRSNETKRLIKKNHARAKAKKVLLYKEGNLLKEFISSRGAGKYAVENEICSYGWCGRSLATGEETKSTINYPSGGYLFVYSDDIIKKEKTK